MNDWPYMIFDESGNAIDVFETRWGARWSWLKLKFRYPRGVFYIIPPK